MKAEPIETPNEKAPYWALLLGACVGAWAGFAPAPAVGPGWWIAIAVVLLLLRLPLIWVLAVSVVAKGVALVAEPLSFWVGELLLDGPAAGFFSKVANAPFGALLGLEHYTVTGGLALGLLIGVIASVVGLGRWPGRRWRMPIRPLGIVFVLVMLGGVWFSRSSFAESLFAQETATTLGKLNGATADVTGVELDLVGARLKVADVSLANPNQLSTNIFQGLELTADLSTKDLFRKRVHIQQVIVRRAESGSPRAVPGVLIGDAHAEPDPVETEEGYDKYLKDFEVWKERIRQAREWIESMSEEAEPEPSEIPLSERTAPNIVEPAPSLLISEILIEGLSLDTVSNEVFSVSAHNVSTRPSLVKETMEFALKANSDAIAFGFTMPSGADPGRLQFSMRDVPINSITKLLRLKSGDGLTGGTLNLELDGPWAGGVAGVIDLPLKVTLLDTKLSIGGSKPYALDKLVLPIQLNGRIDQPRIGFDNKLLVTALRDAGAAEVATLVEARKAELLKEGKALLEEELGDLLGKDIDLGDELSIDGLKEFGNKELEDLKDQAQEEIDALKEQAKSEADKLKQKALDDLLKKKGDDAPKDLEGELESQKQTVEEQAKQKADELKKKGLEKLFGKPK